MRCVMIVRAIAFNYIGYIPGKLDGNRRNLVIIYHLAEQKVAILRSSKAIPAL